MLHPVMQRRYLADNLLKALPPRKDLPLNEYARRFGDLTQVFELASDQQIQQLVDTRKHVSGSAFNEHESNEFSDKCYLAASLTNQVVINWINTNARKIMQFGGGVDPKNTIQ